MASSDSDSDSDSDSISSEVQAICDAVRAFDVEALRRCLAAGVDPNLREPRSNFPLLYYALLWGSGVRPEVQGRLACISVLLEAGASVDIGPIEGRTPLHWIVSYRSPAYQAVIALLIKSGADVNATFFGGSVLETAAVSGVAATVKKLITAGAVGLDTALVRAIANGKQRNCAPLLRAGAAIPAAEIPQRTDFVDQAALADTRAYIAKIRAARSYKAYERAHRQRLVAIFLPKFPTLPVEMLGRVLEFTWDIGGH